MTKCYRRYVLKRQTIVNKKVRIAIIRLSKHLDPKPLNSNQGKRQNQPKVTKVSSNLADSNLYKKKKNNFCINLII